MIRLSIPLRQALSRLSLPVLVALAFGTMLIGKADTLLVERARMALADTLSPIYAAVAEPLGAVREGVQEARLLWAMRAENARLREATGLPVSVAEDALACVALGTGRALDEMKRLRHVLTSMY